MAKNRIAFWLKDSSGTYLQLPVNPETVEISSPFEIKTINIAQMGDVSIVGNRGLKQASFSSFFPRDYNPTYCEYNGFKSPSAWVKQIEKWRDSRKEIRLIIAGTDISMPVYIPEFTIEPERAGSPGDIYYSISFTEYKQMKTSIIEVVKNTPTPTSKRPSSPKSTKKTYTVVRGDSLWKIAKRFYGNGARWTTIYNANKSVVGKNPDLIYPGQKLVIP